VSALLRVEGLAVELAGGEALSDVTFEVDRHACVGLVGETGCGKSLTCRVVLGLLPRIHGRVVRGTAVFDGVDLLALREAEWSKLRGRRIALVPQASLTGLDPVMKIGRQIIESLRALDPEVDARARARELLEQVQMPRAAAVMKLYPHELSGGMRQRVMIALALAGRPELLLADEPTTALDVTVQRSILELLAELRRDTGMALVLVTHDLAVVQSVADSMVVMYAGRVVEHGPTARVLDLPAHPYTAALIGARPTLAGHAARLVTIPGAAPGLLDRPSGCAFSPRCRHAIDQCREVPPLIAVEAGGTAACWRSEEVLQ
jgi:oligopeptide/dipeptide ABC transporter ATP-binding protein